MKYAILVVLTIGITLNTYSQSRINNNQLEIGARSTKLKEATGWKKDALGNWISNTNAISDIHLDEQTRYSVPQNFKWLQLVEFNANSKPHYALLYESDLYITGLQKEKRVYYYLMSPASYNNLVTTIQNKTGETLTIHSSTYGYMSNSDGIYTQEKLLNLIARSILNSSNNQLDLIINAQHIDREDVVRFRLPSQPDVISKSLEDSYFESKWNSFNSILLPTKAIARSDEFELEGGVSTVTNNNVENDLPDRVTIENRTDSVDVFSFNDTSNIAIDTANTDSLDTMIDRISKEKAYVSEPIATLGNITGWYKNAEGKWVEDNDPSYRFEAVGKYEFHRFVYRGTECLILARHEKYAGTSYYLIKKEDYEKEIAKLDYSSMLNFPIIASLGIGHTLDDIAKKGEEYIDSPEDEMKIIIRDNYFSLQQRNSKSKNIARFFFFEKNCTQYGESGSTMCNTNVSNKIRYDDVPYIGTESLFDKMYYEVNGLNFVGFLKAPLNAKTTTNNKQITDRILD